MDKTTHRCPGTNRPSHLRFKPTMQSVAALKNHDRSGFGAAISLQSGEAGAARCKPSCCPEDGIRERKQELAHAVPGPSGEDAAPRPEQVLFR